MRGEQCHGRLACCVVLAVQLSRAPPGEVGRRLRPPNDILGTYTVLFFVLDLDFVLQKTGARQDSGDLLLRLYLVFFIYFFDFYFHEFETHRFKETDQCFTAIALCVRCYCSYATKLDRVTYGDKMLGSRSNHRHSQTAVIHSR